MAATLLIELFLTVLLLTAVVITCAAMNPPRSPGS